MSFALEVIKLLNVLAMIALVSSIIEVEEVRCGLSGNFDFWYMV